VFLLGVFLVGLRVGVGVFFFLGVFFGWFVVVVFFCGFGSCRPDKAK